VKKITVIKGKEREKRTAPNNRFGEKNSNPKKEENKESVDT